MDGCYYNSNGLNVIKNPAQFHDSANGVLVGLPVSGYPKDFAIPTQSGLEWALYPSEAGGSTTTYVPDSWVFDGSSPCLFHGGNYNQNGNHGLFYVNYNSASNSNRNIGCRVLLGLATHLHSSSSQAAERAPRPTGQGLLSPLLLLFLANPLMLGFARMGRGEGVIFLGTPWCRLANRTRFRTLPQPAGAVERS